MKLQFKITAFLRLECLMQTDVVRTFCNGFSSDELEFPQ